VRWFGTGWYRSQEKLTCFLEAKSRRKSRKTGSAAQRSGAERSGAERSSDAHPTGLQARDSRRKEMALPRSHVFFG